jgi:hypothetical protein
MLWIVKLGVAATLTGLVVALAGEWAVIAGAFATYRDVQAVLVGCVLDAAATAALALTVYGVVRGARP